MGRKAESREWMLFKSRYPAVPLTSPELPEDLTQSTLLARVKTLSQRHHGKAPY